MTDSAESAISELEDVAGRFSDGAVSEDEVARIVAHYDATLDNDDARSVVDYFGAANLTYDLFYVLTDTSPKPRA